jgi:hypothetical protein
MPFSVQRRSQNTWIIKKKGVPIRNKVFRSRASALATVRNYKNYNRKRGEISHLKAVRRRRGGGGGATVVIKGFSACPYFQKAVRLANTQKKRGRVKKLTIRRYTSKTFFRRVAKSCPLVIFNGTKLRGGYESLKNMLAAA